MIFFFSSATNEWKVEVDDYGNPLAETTYGTDTLNAYKLCELALNLKFPHVYDTIIGEDGKEKKVINQAATLEARMKQEELKKAFKTWIWQDEARKNIIVDFYNKKFNSIVPRQYKGDHLIFPNISAGIKLEPHQKEAIAHSLYGGNTLFAHAVGAGKTFEIAASIMESHRLGLSKKAMVIVPKHLTGQFGAEFMRIYPDAKVLIASKDDFTKENRKKFLAKIATQKWDAVVMSYNQFEQIPLSEQCLKDFLEEELNALQIAVEDARYQEGSKWSVKRIEAQKRKLESKIQKIEENIKKGKTDMLCFEDLGIDKLAIDEAHYFKNLYITTKMSNIAGVQTTTADKTEDLFLKTKYLNKTTHNKALIFATGTPVSNSMTELYTMQRYLQPDRLQDMGLLSFDSWAANFGETVISMELKPEGVGYQEKARFSKFYNLPELMSMFKEIADIKTPDMLKLDVPETEFVVEKCPASLLQKEFVDSLSKRADKIRKREVSRSEDNMLDITRQGRSAALDVRILFPNAPDFPESKVNKCVKNVLNVYEETKAARSTQIIFCDQSTPSGKKAFCVYDDIKQKLIESGVPEKEIAFIHDAKNDTAKEKLFEKVRAGEIRILLGSTDMLGVGTNVQDKLIATHDLDVPWRPADLEQRRGRIARRGNKNKNVKVFRYVTEGTFDAYMWQIIENKQKFISQIMTSKAPARVSEEVDELVLSAAEIKAIATGNPLIKEKMEVDNALARLKIARNKFYSDKQKLKKNIKTDLPRTIAQKEIKLEKLMQDKITVDKNALPKDQDGKELFMMELNGKAYTDEKTAGEAFVEALKGNYHEITGHYKGLRINVVVDFMTSEYKVCFCGKTSHELPLASFNHTSQKTLNFREMRKLADTIAEDVTKNKQELEQLNNNLKTAQEEIDKPFAKEDEYKALSERAIELEVQINTIEKEKDQQEENERGEDNEEEREDEEVVGYAL